MFKIFLLLQTKQLFWAQNLLSQKYRRWRVKERATVQSHARSPSSRDRPTRIRTRWRRQGKTRSTQIPAKVVKILSSTKFEEDILPNITCAKFRSFSQLNDSVKDKYKLEVYVK